MKASQVKLTAHFNGLLESIVVGRKEDNNHIRTKQGIVEQLIEAAHKKEVKATGE